MLISILLILLLPFLLAPIYDSIERKVKSLIQSRVGPRGFIRSLLQSWFDIVKLFSKELVITGYGILIITMLELFLTASTAILLQILILFNNLIVVKTLFIVFLSISTAFFITRSIALNNPFASIGVFREFHIVLSTESFFLPSLATVLFINASLPLKLMLLIIIALSCYVLSSRIPFDIAEAEPEIASGVNIELSGPLLGVAMYSLHIKRYVLSEVLSYVLLKLFNVHLELYTFFVITLLTFIIWITTSIISIILARTRVDIGPATMLKTMIILMILTLLIYMLTVK